MNQHTTARLTAPVGELVGPEIEHRVRLEVGGRTLAEAFAPLVASLVEVGRAMVEAFAPLVALVQRPPTRADYALVPRGNGTVGRRPSRHTDPLSQRPATGPQVPAFPKRGKK